MLANEHVEALKSHVEELKEKEEEARLAYGKLKAERAAAQKALRVLTTTNGKTAPRRVEIRDAAIRVLESSGPLTRPELREQLTRLFEEQDRRTDGIALHLAAIEEELLAFGLTQNSDGKESVS